MKTAIITGAASGIGQAIIKILLERGLPHVIGVDKAFRRKLTLDSTEAWRIGCDLSSKKQIVVLFKKLELEFNGPDLLVNAAGVHCAKSITTASDNDFEQNIAVNLAAPFYMMKYALPLMRPGGSIVNVGSDVYFLPDKDAPIYTASKAGLVALTRAAALEWGPKGIRINAVCPGVTDTPFLRNAFGNDAKAIEACGTMNPLRRMATPEEIAKVIVFVGLEATFMNGAAVPVDGGYTVQGGGSEPPKI